jgi:hypothetical protein
MWTDVFPNPIKLSDQLNSFLTNKIFTNSFFDYNIRRTCSILLSQLFFKPSNLNNDFQNMDDASSPKQMLQPASEFSSPEKIQLEFIRPSLSQSESVLVSIDPFTSYGIPKEILTKIADFTDIRTIRNWMGVCKSMRNYSDVWFLLALASEKYPNRAFSGFIADAIENSSDIRLWRSARFSLEGHDVPKGLSIHLFTKTTAEKILSDQVHSLIIQVSEPCDSYPNIDEFLEFLFSKVYFTNLKCLMLHGIRISGKFSQWIAALNLDAFHMSKCSYGTSVTFYQWNALKRLYLMHYGKDEIIYPSRGLKRLVIYCPESSESFIKYTKSESPGGGLTLDARSCHALEEM